MATVVTYTASATARCWKLHDCVGCGCVYRYLFERPVSATAGCPEVAADMMHKAVAEIVQEGQEVHPCPQCGLVQPRMVGHTKYQGHLWVSIISVMLAATAVGIGVAN